MKILLRFARPGYRLAQDVYLEDGEFIRAGTHLERRHLDGLLTLGRKTLQIEASSQARPWELVPSLTEYMTAIQNRFQGRSLPADELMRCAVEDVYTRFLFDLETEETSVDKP